MKKKEPNKIHDLVYNYKTKYEYGFIQSEMMDIVSNFPDINMDKFENAMYGNTCMVIDDEIITYHCDLEKALYCGTENRNLTASEWD